MRKRTCPCCGYLTLDEKGLWQICRICYWEDDPGQAAMPYSDLGANGISLSEAKRNFDEFGAMAEELIGTVDPIRPDDQRDPRWSIANFSNDD